MAGKFVRPAVIIKSVGTAESRQLALCQLSRLLAVVRSEKGFNPCIDAIDILGQLKNERCELVWTAIGKLSGALVVSFT